MTMDDVDTYLALHADPAVARFVGEMDRRLAITRLEADARVWRVATRLGMARLRNDVLDGIPAVGGESLDGIRAVIYAITREEWARRDAGG